MEDFIDIVWGLIVVLGIAAGVLGKGKKKPAQTHRQTKQAPSHRQQQAAPAKPASMLPPRPITPTLHDHSGMFEGSLNADDGTEGSDPHDHGFDHEVDMPSMHSEEAINASLAEKPQAAPATKKPLLDWAPDSLVRAFVMQEVLKRPAARGR